MKTLLHTFALVLLMSSCSRVYYVPNSHNVPLFQEAKEVQLSATIGITENNGVAEVKSAYAIDSVWAAQLNIMFSDYTKGFYVEGAIGRYKALPNNWVVEIYGGVGLGNFKWDTYPIETKFNSVKVYAQSNLGFRSKYFQAAFSLKLGANTIYNGTSTINDYLTQDYANYGTYYGEVYLPKTYIFFVAEPAFTTSVGFKKVKFQTQLGFTMSNAINTYPLLYDTFNFNLGLIVQLNGKN